VNVCVCVCVSCVCVCVRARRLLRFSRRKTLQDSRQASAAVCMCVCMCVCIVSVCVCVQVCLCWCVCVYVCVSVCETWNLYMCRYMCMHDTYTNIQHTTHTHTHQTAEHWDVRRFLKKNVYIHTYIHTHTHTHTHTHQTAEHWRHPEECVDSEQSVCAGAERLILCAFDHLQHVGLCGLMLRM
jgi:hypothetical protein